jgi:RNA polymerase sigma factor (sigma-70 family)
VVRYLDDGDRREDVTVTLHLMDEPFEAHRAHLRGVAYRMLGSLSEAEDAVQEAWLRLHRAGTSSVDNLRAWLTTVVARVCLDMLRARKSRREEVLDTPAAEAVAAGKGPGADPEHEALMADSVGVALLVVLETLAPAERLAFVLHDMFAMPFEEIAEVTGRSATAARQLASRARRRVRGGGAGRSAASAAAEDRAAVEAFLAAMRAGDMEGVVAVLDPDVVVRLDAAGAGRGGPREIHGARAWAQGAVAFSRFGRFIQPALVDGALGLVLAPGGRLWRVVRFEFAGGKIARVEVVTDPARLRQLALAVF